MAWGPDKAVCALVDDGDSHQGRLNALVVRDPKVAGSYLASMFTECIVSQPLAHSSS